ncbi:D-lactonohydrolase-like protein-like protein [Plectosphaerella plurivora]|uniref:D-lactonohydrolase-like protein-like protein n=1 Tax=Plectosphaerella plurivora TaxID=936078 RepID=A0A9P8V8I4_9PEZI|nr:D-lactonohydrolase-like protein-like protein [Plectosphaerella plurivora]
MTQTPSPLFHAACVHLPAQDELYTTSRPLMSTSSQGPAVLISRIKLSRDVDSGYIDSLEWQKLRPPPNMAMPAGGILVPPKSEPDQGTKPDTILFCSQGNLSPGSGGIFLMPRGERPIPCVTSYHGRSFNSPYGATIHTDWSVWFTDPAIGNEGDFREQPMLPPQLYRYDPSTGGVRAMADGFQRPVGVAIDGGRERVYVSDAGTATIYAFDLVQLDGSPFLMNRRLFAFASEGAPTQLSCDDQGNVWAACGDGVEVWSPGGSLLGVIEIPGGATSFCRGKNDELFVCSGKALWCVYLKGR